MLPFISLLAHFISQQDISLNIPQSMQKHTPEDEYVTETARIAAFQGKKIKTEFAKEYINLFSLCSLHNVGAAFVSARRMGRDGAS